MNEIGKIFSMQLAPPLIANHSLLFRRLPSMRGDLSSSPCANTKHRNKNRGSNGLSSKETINADEQMRWPQSNNHKRHTINHKHRMSGTKRKKALDPNGPSADAQETCLMPTPHAYPSHKQHPAEHVSLTQPAIQAPPALCHVSASCFHWSRAGVACHVHQQKKTELGDETATIQGLQESRAGSVTKTDGTTCNQPRSR